MKKLITYKDIVNLKPCYAPTEISMPVDYSDTIRNFITKYKDKVKNKEDIIWILCRKEYMTNKNCRLFAVWCARKALELIKNPDQRSITACDVAEKFANNKATIQELNAARSAAWDAACDAAWDAACDAAYSAAYSAACDAARSAACDAARTVLLGMLLVVLLLMLLGMLKSPNC